MSIDMNIPAPALLLSALCLLTAAFADASAEGGAGGYAKKTAALPTGIDMQYVEAGNHDGHEVIILLHGYTDSSRSFYPTVDALLALDPDLHVYIPDLRGHGGSSIPDGAACAAEPRTCFEMADFARDLLAFMDSKGIASAHLVGHSMGSLVAQEVALTRPAKVDSLVLIGTAARVAGNPVLEGFILESTLQGDGAGLPGRWRGALEADASFGAWPRDAYERTPLDADPHAESFMAANWVADATADPDFLRQIVPESARVRLGTWLGAAEALLEVDNTAELADLQVDSLILWATQDVVFHEADQRALRAALDAAAAACRSGYTWKEYGKATLPAEGQTDLGHNTQWGAPAQVAADIYAYVTTGRPTPDLYFADPADPTRIRTERGAARIIAVPAATGCN